MYRWLCRHLPPRAAEAVLTLWYLALMLLLVLLAGAGSFKAGYEQF